jgi:hypothetical protein
MAVVKLGPEGFAEIMHALDPNKSGKANQPDYR